MFNRIYIEKNISSHPKTLEVCERFPGASIIECKHYSEVFNPKSQNFRLQKKSPGLILAHKNQRRVLPAPHEYNIGGDKNFYFSHMLNCIYDCQYCFLQGMYRSANYILFVNYEDFYSEILNTINLYPHQSCHFFSGYDCDSLAMEPVTGFMDFLLPQFGPLSGSLLELRTKSTQIRSLLSMPPQDNCVVAFSLLPQRLASVLDKKAPDISSRLNAALKLQNHGWKIGLRFDPLIYDSNLEQLYEALFIEISRSLDVHNLHSITIGSFRLPSDYFQTLSRYYPHETLFLSPFEQNNKQVSYKFEFRKMLFSYCYQAICSYFPEDIIFPCEPVEQYL